MKKLAEEYPVPISWKETRRIKEILAARNQARPVPFAVIFIGQMLFKQIVSGSVETTTDYQSCAAFKDPTVAHAAARILNDMGQIGVRFTTITNESRAPETFISKLSDVGFES